MACATALHPRVDRGAAEVTPTWEDDLAGLGLLLLILAVLAVLASLG